MEDYLQRVTKIKISKLRKASPDLLADDRERAEYRSWAGTLLHLGQAVFPQACMATSKMQQNWDL